MSFQISFKHVGTPQLWLTCFLWELSSFDWSDLLATFLTLVCLRLYVIWSDQFQMIDYFSGWIQLTRQPLLHSSENQLQTARVAKTGISSQLWKITHTNYTFLSSVYNWASLLIQNRNFGIKLMECWYPESKETIY